jgi:hypothetical protein
MYNFANRAKNSLLNLQPWKLHEKITLSIGDKYDVFNKDGKKILRITLKNISEQEMPVPYDIPVNHRPKTYNTETATLCVDPSFFVYHGSYTKRILTDPLTDDGLFALTKHSNVEVNHSIFFFNVAYTTENEQLFRCLVDHINPAKKEVELDIYFLQLEKQGSTGTKPLYLTIS